MTRKKTPHLTEADAEVWHEVTKTINKIAPVKLKTKLAAPKIRPKKPAPIINVLEPMLAKTKTKYLSIGDSGNLDTKTLRNMAKGQVYIDAKLDLHGFTEAQAFNKLVAFVQSSYACSHRLLLVVTGKGTENKPSVLRSRMQTWVNTESIAPFILRVSYAARKHGGEGAFYLYLRRHNHK